MRALSHILTRWVENIYDLVAFIFNPPRAAPIRAVSKHTNYVIQTRNYAKYIKQGANHD